MIKTQNFFIKNKKTINLCLIAFSLIPLALCINAVYSVLNPKLYNNRFFSNMAASISYIVLILFSAALNSGFNKNFMRILPIIFGIFSSIIGDYFLSGNINNESSFLFGVGFYFLGHFGYLLFYSLNQKKNRKKYIIFLLISIVYLIYFFLYLNQNINTLLLKVAVISYVLISAATFSATFTLNFNVPFKIISILGISLLVFSDTLIAAEKFGNFSLMSRWVLPTFIISQFLIFIGCLLNLCYNKNEY